MVKEKELYTMYSHISLVNIDAKIEEEWLVKMIKNIENNDEKSLFGCKILDIDNRQKYQVWDILLILIMENL